jgi:hypothetical protein
VILLVPTIRSHDQYQCFLQEQLRHHFVSGSRALFPSDLALIRKFWNVDLSRTAILLSSTYGKKGPAPRDPADLLRSYLLMLELRQTSITRWVDLLRRCDFYAILSGFTPGHTPGVGTFYDFFRRLWDHPADHLCGHLKPPKRKPKKGKNGGKAPTTSTGQVARLAKRLQQYPDSSPTMAFDTLFELFKEMFVLPSVSLGLLGDPDHLSIAADGTPIRTSSRGRSKRDCSCREQGIDSCSCRRRYSQPDCDYGWDSSRDCYFHGYHLYMFTAADSKHDLPLYPRLHRASRHDSVSLLVSAHEFSHRFPTFTWSRALLDAAHDAMPIYKLLLAKGVQPFIDLNPRKLGHTTYKDDFTLSAEGVPICKKGLAMKSDGYDYTRGRRKYRCPLVKNRIVSCDTPCSDSPCGRTVYTYTQENPRLFPSVARGSDEWKRMYARRTTVERCNKREKNDYMLEAARHRSTRMWTIRLYGIMMCQHLDAWAEESTLDLKSSLFIA